MFKMLITSFSLGLLTLGCSSTSSHLSAPETHTQTEIETSSEALASQLCDTPPAPCCTQERAPACRGCQEEQRIWESTCNKPAHPKMTEAECAKAQDFTAMTPEEAQAWRAGCREHFDCKRPEPVRACCLALIESCLTCAERGLNGAVNHAFACFGDLSPIPSEYDCSKPLPTEPCCKALTPSCLACVDRNDAIRQGYLNFCSNEQP